MPVFDTFEAMKTYIESELKDTLGNEIADMVDETIKKHAESDVYDVYDPHFYDRRNLLRSGDFYIHDLSGFTLTVMDVTPGDTPTGEGHNPTGKELPDIIEHGLQNNGHGKWLGAFARPYIANAQEEVDTKVIEVLKSKFA